MLKARLAEDGYLFVRDLLDTDVLASVLELIVDELSRLDVLDLSIEPSAHHLPARAGVDLYSVLADLSMKREVREITRQSSLRGIFSVLFGEEAKALDYIWPRVAGPGRSELPHCDWVYMCRGTDRLLTAWIPLMDVPVELGPLMVLERSHVENAYTRTYLNLDVDGLGFLDGLRVKHGRLVRGGRYSKRPDKVQKEFGTRWLTEDFRQGDVIIFSPRCLHATLDNQTGGFRASVDTRFQPVADRTDLRFVGPNPAAHTNRRKSVLDNFSRLKNAFSR